MPRTRQVLPAPRPPVIPMTHPGAAARPNCSPMRSVSAGLREVSVAMFRELVDAPAIPEAQAGVVGDSSDAREGDVREACLPSVEDGHSAAAGHGEEQL